MPAEDFIITRKRKKYRFAKFAEAANAFEINDWVIPKTDRSITLEIGAGTGLFSVELATKYPGRFFVAVDVKADRLQKGARVALERGLDNIQFVRIHAMRLDQLLRVKADEIWVTFPDPHPKKRNIKHRLLHMVFLQQYRNLLQTRGKLYFKTDNHTLFDWSLEQLVANEWQIETLSYDLHSLPEDILIDARIMTTYELRFVAEGLPTHFLIANPNLFIQSN